MRKFQLFVILLVPFIDWFGIGLVYPVFSAMLFSPESTLVAADTTQAMRGTLLGILLAANPLATFFCGPLLGMLSDQKGRKKMLVLGMGVGVAGYLIAMGGVWLSSIVLLILSRIVVGISAGTLSVVSATIADRSQPETKARYFGLLNMACGSGFTVGPFVGGYLAEWHYSYPFFFSGVLTLLNLLLLKFFFLETHKGKKGEKVNWSAGVRNIQKAFRMPALSLVFLVAFLFGFGWSFYFEFVPVTWIGEFGLSTREVGTLFGFAAGFYAISAGLLIRPIVDRFKADRVLFWSLLIQGIYILLFLLKPRGWLLWAYPPFQQFLLALCFPTISTLVSNAVSAEVQGETLGILQSVQSVAFSLSPLVAGTLLGISLQMPAIVGGICMLLAAGCVLLSSRWKMKRPA